MALKEHCQASNVTLATNYHTALYMTMNIYLTVGGHYILGLFMCSVYNH